MNRLTVLTGAGLDGPATALALRQIASEFWLVSGAPDFGLTVEALTLVFMSVVVACFTLINLRGASETGKIGNFGHGFTYGGHPLGCGFDDSVSRNGCGGKE